MMKKIISAITLEKSFLLLGISILPVYIFNSGGVQPAHAFLFVFASLTLFLRGLQITSVNTVLFLIFLYTLVVEVFYSILNSNASAIVHSIFFMYNFILVSGVYVYCRQEGGELLVPGVFLASLIVFFTIIAANVGISGVENGERSVGTFNNPNQLGYFSVCLLSIGCLFYRGGLLGYKLLAILLCMSLFFSIESLSKAAMVANFLVILFALKPRSSSKRNFLWLFFVFILAIAFLNIYLKGFWDDYSFLQRLENMRYESDSSLDARGYFAFLNGNAAQVVFGLGYEFVNEIVGHEVHSTLGSVLNNYGLVGFIIFSFAIAFWVIKVWNAYGLVGVICIAGPSLLYGITHNGVRFTFFWLLVASSMAMAQRQLTRISHGV